MSGEQGLEDAEEVS